MNKFSTAPLPPSSERSEEIIRPTCATRKAGVPGLLNVPYSAFAGADPKRVPSRVAQRTQVGAFVAS